VLKHAALACLMAGSTLPAQQAQALGFKKDMKKGRRAEVPESEYKELADGLKYYDVKVGGGQLAKVGDRVAVHYEARWRGITFMTSRQGMGVTGGSPIGFDIGTDPKYGTLPGLDLGVRGMRVGGQRLLIVPPELAYGEKGIGEIPGNATLTFTVELLSIKTSPLGSRVKLVEG
jgi:FKBP-type peptidyl-prolyl cis-trans isomerase